MSITDVLNLQLDNYKKPLLKPFLNGAKWIWNKTKSCCINTENDIGYGSINNDNVEDGVVINNPENNIKYWLEQQAITEAKKTNLNGLFKKINSFNINEINEVQPSVSEHFSDSRYAVV